MGEGGGSSARREPELSVGRRGWLGVRRIFAAHGMAAI